MLYRGENGPPDPKQDLREEIEGLKADLARLINLCERARTGGKWISDGELRELAGLVEDHAVPVFQQEILNLYSRLDDDEPRGVELK